MASSIGLDRRSDAHPGQLGRDVGDDPVGTRPRIVAGDEDVIGDQGGGGRPGPFRAVAITLTEQHASYRWVAGWPGEGAWIRPRPYGRNR